MAIRLAVTFSCDPKQSDAEARLVADLARFQTRAKNRRIKQLALLGLWAEETGLRAFVEQTLARNPGPAPAPAAEPPPPAPVHLEESPEFLAGMSALMSAILPD